MFFLTKPVFWIARIQFTEKPLAKFEPVMFNYGRLKSLLKRTIGNIDDALPHVLSRQSGNIPILTNNQLTTIESFVVGMYNRHLVKHGIELD